MLTPNLTNSNATIEFSLPHPDCVTLTVYNLSGHEIASLINQNLGQGAHSIAWNTRNLAAGCYTVKMQVGSTSLVKAVAVLR